jgi:hypothetical protein
MNGISAGVWATYKNIINSAHDMFNQDEIIWFKTRHNLQRFGEDDKSLKHYDQIPLKVLIGYNVYRSWPMTKETESGSIDKESILLIINKKYLNDLGYINANGNFDFSPGDDYFTHQGQKLRASGETPAAQANDEPLLVYIILKRMETNTGSNKF